MNIYVEDTRSLSMHRIRKSFFKYAPAWVNIVEDFRDADVFFYWSFFRFFNPYPNGLDRENAWYPENETNLLDYYQSLSGKSRIFWFDVFCKYHEYPDFLSERDVAISVNLMPPHPNAVRTQVIDPEEFYCFAYENRLPKSVMIMAGHIVVNTSLVSELRQLLSDGSIETIISNDHPDLVYSWFRGFPLRVFAKSFHEAEYFKALNLVDYTLQTQVGVGMEMVGLEGGFCGAQPIYPDTEYYRDLFYGDDLGVQYFDTNCPLESLTDIFKRPLEWREKHKDKFIEVFSAKRHIPAFWEHARQIIGDSI